MRTWMFVAVVALMASSLARADVLESNRETSTVRGADVSSHATRSDFMHSNVGRERRAERSLGGVPHSGAYTRSLLDKAHNALHH